MKVPNIPKGQSVTNLLDAYSKFETLVNKSDDTRKLFNEILRFAFTETSTRANTLPAYKASILLYAGSGGTDGFHPYHMRSREGDRSENGFDQLLAGIVSDKTKASDKEELAVIGLCHPNVADRSTLRLLAKANMSNASFQRAVKAASDILNAERITREVKNVQRAEVAKAEAEMAELRAKIAELEASKMDADIDNAERKLAKANGQ